MELMRPIPNMQAEVRGRGRVSAGRNSKSTQRSAAASIKNLHIVSNNSYGYAT